MLRIEDCKPGVEVICIDNGFRNIRSLFRPNAWHVTLLRVGRVYTCDGLAPPKENAFPPGLPCIYLGEINAHYKSGNRVAFGIDRFKLKPPKAESRMDELKNLLDQPVPQDIIDDEKREMERDPVRKKEDVEASSPLWHRLRSSWRKLVHV